MLAESSIILPYVGIYVYIYIEETHMLKDIILWDDGYWEKEEKETYIPYT